MCAKGGKVRLTARYIALFGPLFVSAGMTTTHPALPEMVMVPAVTSDH